MAKKAESKAKNKWFMVKNTIFAPYFLQNIEKR